jgi:hypothetical protein
MPYTLFHLIKASGNAGTSGQSFRNHVTGAASGTKMSDYKISTANYAGEEPTTEFPYNHGEVFNMTLTFNGQGNHAHHIKRTGNVIVASVGSPAPNGFSVSSVSNIVGASSGSTVDVTGQRAIRRERRAVWLRVVS